MYIFSLLLYIALHAISAVTVLCLYVVLLTPLPMPRVRDPECAGAPGGGPVGPFRAHHKSRTQVNYVPPPCKGHLVAALRHILLNPCGVFLKATNWWLGSCRWGSGLHNQKGEGGNKVNGLRPRSPHSGLPLSRGPFFTQSFEVYRDTLDCSAAGLQAPGPQGPPEDAYGALRGISPPWQMGLDHPCRHKSSIQRAVRSHAPD